jgi:AAA15 family ATPase/GTPase
VVIGANGCGKSNLLEAIALAGLSCSGTLLPELFESRGIRVTDNRFMRSAFDDIDEEYIQILVTTMDGDMSSYQIHYNTSKKPAQWEDVVEDDTKELLTSLIEKGNNYKLDDLLAELKHIKNTKGADRQLNVKFSQDDGTYRLSKSRVNGLKTFTIYSLEESALRSMDGIPSTKLGRTGKGLLPYLKELSKTDEGKVILKEIKENMMVIDWFEDLEMPDTVMSQDSTLMLKDRYLDESLAYFDQRNANEAFLYLLFYFTLFISDETPSFFAIDNIEASLNPKLCKEVIKNLAMLAERHGKQVILTTHSPFVLDGIEEVTDKKLLFVASRNSDGYTVVNKIKADAARTVPLSEAWLKGYIGGLPNNF